MNDRAELQHPPPARGKSLLIFLWLPLVCLGSDWPQYRGPNHDGISLDRINKQWTGSVTNPVWRISLTNCLGSMAVSGGRLLTQTRRPAGAVSKEVCVALSITNGAELWATNLDDAVYPQSGVGFDDGPRTTPTVDGDSVYVLTSYLKLYRLNVTNGAVIWQKNLVSVYGSSVIGWQNAASPVVEGGLIFLNANCGTSTMMALRTSDGSAAWRSQNDAMTHSTPVLAMIQGVRQLIFATQSGLVSLDPLTGIVLWRHAYPFPYGTSIGVSPVVYEDMVFVCGAHSYGMGSVTIQARLTNSNWTTTRLWSTNNPASHWMTPVVHQGFLYGQFGIQTFDSVNAQLKCVDMRTGAVKWSTNGFGRGATLLVDDHLLSITERGQLVLARPNTNAYDEVARFLAIPGYSDPINKCWNAPAVADGRVYVRSTASVAAFDFSIPELKLSPPQIAAGGEFELMVGTIDGTPVSSNRLAGLDIRATTNLGEPFGQWTRLTNGLALSNGVVRIMDNADPGMKLQRYFIVSEPR